MHAAPSHRDSLLLRRLAGLDAQSSLLVAPQLQYCEGAFQWGVDVQDILFALLAAGALHVAQHNVRLLP